MMEKLTPRFFRLFIFTIFSKARNYYCERDLWHSLCNTALRSSHTITTSAAEWNRTINSYLLWIVCLKLWTSAKIIGVLSYSKRTLELIATLITSKITSLRLKSRFSGSSMWEHFCLTKRPLKNWLACSNATKCPDFNEILLFQSIMNKSREFNTW